MIKSPQPVTLSRRYETVPEGVQALVVAQELERENLCGLLEKKNRFLGWSTRSVRLKGSNIEYSKRNGKTKVVSLSDIISVNAKGTEIEFVLLTAEKQWTLKLRAENEILAFRWLKVVETARRKHNTKNQKRRLRSSLRRSDSDSLVALQQGKALLKKQATCSDIRLRLSDASDASEDLSDNESKGESDEQSLPIVDSPTTTAEASAVENSDTQKNLQPKQLQTKTKQTYALAKKVVFPVPDVVSVFAKDLFLVFMQPVMHAVNVLVNTINPQK